LSETSISLKGEFVKPSLFVSGLFIFSFLVIGIAPGAAEMYAGKELIFNIAVPATAKMDEAVVRSAPT
jgi:hypothetical protein